MPFEVGQRVRTSNGEEGMIESIDCYINVKLDSGRDIHTLSNGSSCCAGGSIEVIDTPLPEPTPLGDFKVGLRVVYHMGSAETAEGEIVLIDDTYIHVKLDDGQSHIRNLETPRVFNRDGSGVGRFISIPEGTRTSDAAGSLAKAPPKWEPTKGREYPAKPVVAYGAFDTYYGRPLQPRNPNGEEVKLGWGVITDDTSFTQVIFDNEQAVGDSGYLTAALSNWRDKCYDIDLAAIENPFDLLLGLTLSRAWAYGDSFGCEFTFPVELQPRRSRATLTFTYPRALCAYGLMDMDELNAFFASNAGAMNVDDVDGDKITINGTSFHVAPRLIANFKPRPNVDSTASKLRLLQNLVMQRAKRDSTREAGLALAA